MLCLDAILKIISELKIKTILLEGGSKISASFLNKKLIDVIYLYKSNSFIGKEGLNAIDQIKNVDRFKLYNQVKINQDQLEVWINKKIIDIAKK